MPKLYVVATPIGNLSDASARMIETLRGVALIAAEDTRVTGNLLRHFDIHTRMTSLHRHNEEEKSDGIVRRMIEEEIDIALVTDAGTPAISDPGYILVRQAVEAGVEALAVPGPTAMAAALSVSGFDVRSFAFYGFLPRERGELAKRLLEIARCGIPVAVMHESPHRVTAFMETVAEILPGCRACVCCDLTKLYEKSIRADADVVAKMLRDNPKTGKGEYCIVLDLRDVVLADVPVASTASLEAQLFDYILEGIPTQEAVAMLVGQGARKNDAKRAALRVKQFIDGQAGR